jgi:hypothetical protein
MIVSGSPIRVVHPQEVVRQGGDHCPGGVGCELAGGEVRECLVFEVTDREFHDCVLAVLRFDELERVGAVGQEREVAPVGPQLGLGADQAGAADDQPLAAEHRLRDLCFPALGVVLEGLPVLLIAVIAALMCFCWRTPIE